MEAYSLLEVNQYIKRVIALNFEDPFWVECEINQVSRSRSSLYLDLIEKDEGSDEILARNSATIWYRQQSFIRKKLGELYHTILADGVKVKLKVQLVYSERYGLSMNILDVDAAYTFGQFEMNRQKIVQKLREKNLIELNRRLPLPSVITRIAIISSETAAGYQDFKNQLAANGYRYRFTADLFKAAMQGRNTEREVVAALRTIGERDYDIVAIIRGGGSKLDLASFDNYNIAVEIASLKIPVFTGIGHDIDMTVTDMVAHRILKTPTAVADFIIEHNLRFETEISYMFQSIHDKAKSILSKYQIELNQLEHRVVARPGTVLELRKRDLKNYYADLVRAATGMITRKNADLANLQQQLRLLDPEKVLERGFAMIHENGQLRTRAAQLGSIGSKIEIQFSDAKVKAIKDQ